MDARATVFPSDAQARLAELGLREEPLRRAISEGLLARLNCTDNHPPAYRGMVAWGETVRALRDALAPEGWVGTNEGNSPLVSNEAGDLAITVVLGDDGTGDETKVVSTKYGRGPKTFQHVRVNALQLSYFPDDARTAIAAQQSGCQVWMLLHYLDLAAREVRCELSLPVRIGDDARPDQWQERILLEAIPIDDDAMIFPADTELLGPDIDIPVEKRG